MEKSEEKYDVLDQVNKNHHNVEWDIENSKGIGVLTWANLCDQNKVLKQILVKKICKLISRMMKSNMVKNKEKGQQFDLDDEKFHDLCIVEFIMIINKILPPFSKIVEYPFCHTLISILYYGLNLKTPRRRL